MIEKDDEIANIALVIKKYFLGTFRFNENLVREVFNESAKIVGYIDSKLCEWTLEEFIQRLKENNSIKQKYDKRIISIDLSDNVGVVKTQELVNDIYFIDYISLVKFDDTWKIVSKLFKNVELVQ